jgi:hypothetical protein
LTTSTSIAKHPRLSAPGESSCTCRRPLGECLALKAAFRDYRAALKYAQGRRHCRSLEDVKGIIEKGEKVPSGLWGV